jgi:hypothetical protein
VHNDTVESKYSPQPLDHLSMTALSYSGSAPCHKPFRLFGFSAFPDALHFQIAYQQRRREEGKKSGEVETANFSSAKNHGRSSFSNDIIHGSVPSLTHRASTAIHLTLESVSALTL